MSITIRQARPEDAAAIYDMIYELAVYEKAPEEVVTTPDEIRKTLFGADSKTEALVAEYAGHAVGYAVFSPAIPPGLVATASIWKICMSPRNTAARVREKHCLKISRNAQWNVTAAGWNGACLTGTSLQLIFI